MSNIVRADFVNHRRSSPEIVVPADRTPEQWIGIAATAIFWYEDVKARNPEDPYFKNLLGGLVCEYMTHLTDDQLGEAHHKAIEMRPRQHAQNLEQAQ